MPGACRLSRRAILSGLLAGIPLRSLPQAHPAPANLPRPRLGSLVQIQVHVDKTLGRIPADFMGLGYEISSVAELGLLTSANQAYVQFVRTLGEAGVIRIGGNTSDYASWSQDGPAVSSPKATVVDRRSLVDLASFLRATGWRLIWGLNLGQGSIAEAVDEAVAVAASVGDSLLAFEIGNEPDLFPGVHRPGNYSYADYFAEYGRFKQAIRDKLPTAPFAGPDVLVQTDWLEQFAATEASDLQLLTHHYYAEGPPENPASTIENLLKSNEGLTSILARAKAASSASGVPYRICETNSCFGGGKAGVSDTMAAALWGLDLMFLLAESNAGGINFETGINQLGFFSWYSPIGLDSAQGYRAQPLYYAMLAFRVAGHGDRLSLTMDANGLNLTAYAAQSDSGETWLTLINKEAARQAFVRASCPGFGSAGALRLTAPSLTSKDDARLGGTAVASSGAWTPPPLQRVRITGGELELTVPAASAALIHLR
jgi:hypothetical protein